MRATLWWPLFGMLLAGPAGAVRENDDGGPSTDVGEEGVLPPETSSPAPAAPANTAADPQRSGGSELKILRIAVQDLQVTGADPRLVKVAGDSLLVELRKLRGVSVIGMDEIRAMLEQESNKAAIGCDDEDSCLADIAGALGAEELLSGSVAEIGNELVFGLRRINQAEARVVGSVNKRLKKGDGEELLAAIGPTVAELFPELTLRKGQSRGVAEEVALKLNPPPLSPWMFWSIAATSAAFAAAASSLWLANAMVSAYYRVIVLDGLNKPGANFGEVGPVQVAVNGLFITAGLATVGALVTVAGAAVAFPFTDFQGYRDAVQSAEVTE